jgi:putative flippase GtrA
MLSKVDAALPFLSRAALWAQSNPHLSARAFRYSLIGLGTGAVFSSITVIAVSFLGMPPIFASALGYLCSVPLSFFGHRGFTFRSQNTWRSDVSRFFLVHSCSLMASVLIMTATTGMQLPYYLGLLGAVFLIPFVNFLVSNFWVFAIRWKGE